MPPFSWHQPWSGGRTLARIAGAPWLLALSSNHTEKSMQSLSVQPSAPSPRLVSGYIESGDPLADLEQAVQHTPTGQAIAPDDLARFHLAAQGLFDDVQLEPHTILAESGWRPLVASLVLLELLLTIRQFDLAVQLGELLYAGHPMDHRVQDSLFRARLYRKTGRVAEHPGQELKGNYCPMLWNAVHVLPGGNMHSCCSVWMRTPIGNVYQQSVDEVWHGPQAQAVRQSGLDGDYRFCGKISCPHIQRAAFDDNALSKGFWLTQAPALPAGPARFNLSYDLSCNLSCPSCRKDMIVAKGPELERIERATDALIDALRDADRVEVTGSGDPFASKSFRRLLQRINRNEFPRLRITIMSNGQLMRRSEWPKFEHLHGMIDAVNISVDAAQPETYRVLRRGGELDDLIPNLHFIGELRARGDITQYRLCFVVQQQNYREMGDFYELARAAGADEVHFQMLHDWGTMPAAQLNRQRVHLAEHPEFPDFVECLKALPQEGKPRVLSDFSYLI